MITIIAATKELANIKTHIEDAVNILQVIETGSITSLSIILDDVPFELSTEESIQSLKRIICKNGEYEETEIADKNKVIVIGAFGEDTDIVFLAKK